MEAVWEMAETRMSILVLGFCEVPLYLEIISLLLFVDLRTSSLQKSFTRDYLSQNFKVMTGSKISADWENAPENGSVADTFNAFRIEKENIKDIHEIHW